MLLKLYDSLIDFGERKINLLYKLFSVFYGGYSHFFHKEANEMRAVEKAAVLRYGGNAFVGLAQKDFRLVYTVVV